MIKFCSYIVLGGFPGDKNLTSPSNGSCVSVCLPLNRYVDVCYLECNCVLFCCQIIRGSSCGILKQMRISSPSVLEFCGSWYVSFVSFWVLILNLCCRNLNRFFLQKVGCSSDKSLILPTSDQSELLAANLLSMMQELTTNQHGRSDDINLKLNKWIGWGNKPNLIHLTVANQDGRMNWLCGYHFLFMIYICSL